MYDVLDIIPFSDGENIVTDHYLTVEERKEALKVYSMKLKYDLDVIKVRKFHFRTEEERTAFISAILKAKGMNNRLD